MREHPMEDSPTYKIWQDMQKTCRPRNGTRSWMTRPWFKFDGFRADMGLVPEGHKLIRIDPAKEFCKANCKYVLDVPVVPVPDLPVVPKMPERNPELRSSIKDKKFGLLTAMHVKTVTKYGERRWKCRCDCKRTFGCDEVKLVEGFVDRCLVCAKRHWRSFKIDIEDKDEAVYKVWYQMVARVCSYNPKLALYYRDRGITVSDSWKKFENFFRDMGERPKGFTQGRIDRDLSYTKENCMWMSRRDAEEDNHDISAFDGVEDPFVHFEAPKPLDFSSLMDDKEKDLKAELGNIENFKKLSEELAMLNRQEMANANRMFAVQTARAMSTEGKYFNPEVLEWATKEEKSIRADNAVIGKRQSDIKKELGYEQTPIDFL